MAYSKSELALHSYSGAGTNGHREYVYENTADDDVTATDFFNESAGQIYTGDIIVDASDGLRYRATNTDGDISVSEVTDSA